VSELISHTTQELLAIPGLGQKSLEEVRSRLADRGWALSGDEEEQVDEVLLGEGTGDLGEPESALLGADYLEGSNVSGDE